MGWWGERFFEGDADLDTASYTSEDAGIELYYYQDENSEFGAKVLQQLAITSTMAFSAGSALAMRIGATIEPKDMEYLRTVHTTIRVSPKYSLPLFDSDFRGPMKRQFETFLQYYKNDGTPYDFNTPRCELPGCDKVEADLPDRQKLLKCGKCKETLYCGKECQSAHWPSHKKVCKTTKQREKERIMPSGLVSMNV